MFILPRIVPSIGIVENDGTFIFLSYGGSGRGKTIEEAEANIQPHDIKVRDAVRRYIDMVYSFGSPAKQDNEPHEMTEEQYMKIIQI